MKRTLPVKATAILLTSLALPGTLLATRAATEKRGFNASGAFQADGPDSISLYTGALSVKVLMGQEYPLGPGFSYRLQLVYNSNGGWETDEPTLCPEGTILPEHDPDNNSGFGWRLSFGTVGPQRLSSPFWYYEDPSGARHGLYSQLHPGYSQPGVFFSNDSTALRMQRYAEARRHNWVDVISPLPAFNSGALDSVVTEVFHYEGPAGRLSSRQTRNTFNGTTFAFNVSQTYDALGNVASITYPTCVHSQGDCPANSPPRTVTYTYGKGFQTAIPGFVDSIAWQAGGTLHEIRHSNGVVYTREIDPANGLARPHRISTTAGWDTGTYAYDGSANIHRIGTLQFRYDLLNRLVSGQAKVGAATRTQTGAYDDFGNVTSLATNGVVQSTPTDPTSNRLNAPLGVYDGNGNLTVLDFGAERYEYDYDGVNMMKHLRSTTDLARIFLYNAADERLAQFDCAAFVCETQGAVETWTLRGFDDKVLRTWVHPWNEGWQWKDDHVYGAGGQLVAMVNQDGTFHVHTDHLGSTRQVTNAAGNQVALHNYYPFGEEATSAAQDDLSLKFTGHERDKNTGRGVLDYMHARHCSPVVGRFLSIDPAFRTEPTSQSQRWNRFLYSGNNPINLIDPDGREEQPTSEQGFGAWFRSTMNRIFTRPTSQVPNVMYIDGEFKRVGPTPEQLATSAAAAVVVGEIVKKASDDSAKSNTSSVKKNKTTGDAYRDEVADSLEAVGVKVVVAFL